MFRALSGSYLLFETCKKTSIMDPTQFPNWMTNLINSSWPRSIWERWMPARLCNEIHFHYQWPPFNARSTSSSYYSLREPTRRWGWPFKHVLILYWKGYLNVDSVLSFITPPLRKKFQQKYLESNPSRPSLIIKIFWNLRSLPLTISKMLASTCFMATGKLIAVN